jgi:hypothetical protein
MSTICHANTCFIGETQDTRMSGVLVDSGVALYIRIAFEAN